MKTQTESRRTDSILAFIYFVAGVVGLFLLFSACSAVKKVNRDEAKQLKVIKNYTKKHPSKNDTTYVYKPGDTITNISERLDTLYLETLPDTVQDTQYKYITKTVTITKTVRDTVFRSVIDRSKEIALQSIINSMDTVIVDLKASYLDMRYKRDKWRLWFFISLAINSLFLYFRVRKLFI